MAALLVVSGTLSLDSLSFWKMVVDWFPPSIQDCFLVIVAEAAFVGSILGEETDLVRIFEGGVVVGSFS